MSDDSDQSYNSYAIANIPLATFHTYSPTAWHKQFNVLRETGVCSLWG